MLCLYSVGEVHFQPLWIIKKKVLAIKLLFVNISNILKFFFKEFFNAKERFVEKSEIAVYMSYRAIRTQLDSGGRPYQVCLSPLGSPSLRL